jgi:hypothetical protein
LEEIQGYPLCCQQGVGWTVYLSDDVPRGQVRSILDSAVQTDRAIHRVKNCDSDFEPRQHESLFGQQMSIPACLGRHNRQGGDISIPNVFFEKTSNKFTQC